MSELSRGLHDPLGYSPSSNDPSNSARLSSDWNPRASGSVTSRSDRLGHDRSKTPESLGLPTSRPASKTSFRTPRSSGAHGSRHSGGFLLEPTSIPSSYVSRSPSQLSSASGRHAVEDERNVQRSSAQAGADVPEKARPSRNAPQEPAPQDVSHDTRPSNRRSGILGRARDGLRFRKMRASEPLQRSQNMFVTSQPLDGQQDAALSETMSKQSSARSASASAIDPNQLVRMALSLSESRRLHLSPGHLASAPAIAGSRRVVSGNNMGPAQTLATTGDSFSQYLPVKRDTSSPIGRFSSPPGDGRESLATEDSTPLPLLGHDHDYHFSQGTLSRAEKARNAIELAYEYKRLLQYLPALKPNGDTGDEEDGSTDHYTFHERENGIGSPFRGLGRDYNPLQYIRNKRIRRTARCPLDGAADGWNNIFTVKSWIDSVGLEAQRPKYRVEDVALLPAWSSPAVLGPAVPEGPSTNTPSNPPKTVLNKVDWSFDPADLLADAYWLEQEDHKAWIESKDGSKIFDHFSRPKKTRSASVDSSKFPELPMDSPLRERMSPSSLPDSDHGSPRLDHETRADADDAVEEFHFHRSSHSQSRAARLTHRLFHRRGDSIASSNMSISDDEHHSLPRNRPRRASTLENVGALKRHMDRFMQKEFREDARRNSSDLQDSPPHSPIQPEHGRRMALQPREASIEEEPGSVLQDSKTSISSHNAVGSKRNTSITTDSSHAPRI